MRKYNFDLATSFDGEDSTTSEQNQLNAQLFAQALEGFEFLRSPRAGAIVTGTAVHESKDFFVIDIPGRKAGGFVSKKESGDLKLGDTAAFWVLESDEEEGAVWMSRQKAHAWERLAEASETGETVVAKVFCTAVGKRDRNVHGLRIVFEEGEFAGIRGFIPRSEVPRGTNYEAYVNTMVEVKVLTVEPTRGRQFGSLVVSINRCLQEKLAEQVALMEVGAIVSGSVKKVIKVGENKNAQGALIELDNGITGFVHESQVTGHPKVNIKDVLTPGLQRDFEVMRVNPKDGKISLGMKGLDRRRLAASLAVGQILNGRVDKVETYGYFVDLGGVVGLLHWSELQVIAGGQTESFKEGDRVDVSIIAMQEDGTRVALSRTKQFEANTDSDSQH